MSDEQTYVLIDTDAGVDDALAIMAVIAAHKRSDIPITIVGMVCVNGNTETDNVVQNVARIMETTNSRFPLYAGCKDPILDRLEIDGPPYHGEDGFGDAGLPPISAFVEPDHGVQAIIDLAHRYKNQGKLTILALGPMTNLAMAVRLDPSIKDEIKAIYAMGGNMKGVGNTTVSAEFNFVYDPESAYVTLSTYTCPIFIVPWEVCVEQTTPVEWRREVLGSINSPEAILLNQIEAKMLEGRDTWGVADQLAAAALIEPLVARFYPGKNPKNKRVLIRKYCTVELYGKYARGLMVVDHNGYLEKPENVTLLTEFDTDLFRRMMLWAAGGPYYKS